MNNCTSKGFNSNNFDIVERLEVRLVEADNLVTELTDLIDEAKERNEMSMAQRAIFNKRVNRVLL